MAQKNRQHKNHDDDPDENILDKKNILKSKTKTKSKNVVKMPKDIIIDKGSGYYNSSNVYSFLKHHGFLYASKKSKSEYEKMVSGKNNNSNYDDEEETNNLFTFYCFDGGYVEIPPKLNCISEFFMNYTISVKKREKIYLAEVATEVSKYYCDFDFIFSEEEDIISLEQFKKVLIYMSEEIENLFNAEFGLVCCTSGLRKLNESKFKQGYHVIFHDMYISKENAKILTDYFIKKLLEKFPEFN